MRPVQLMLEGFGSYRDRTLVDFRDSEYFALVGHTGAGKSTIIDAMTFALFGRVARWDDARKVAPALAPGANRGLVRLVFDVAGARYSAVRELRRATGKNAGVAVKSVRLEQLADPGALGEPDDETTVIASDSEVTNAVERLLGLTFQHFCTCVALPQGEFAAFLHAKPSDRDQILVRVLGLEIYDRIATLAGERKRDQESLAKALIEQLAGYDDATDEAVRAVADREDALEKLRQRVNEAAPALATAIQARSDIQQHLDRTAKQIDVLRMVTVPDGVADLEAERGELIAARDKAAQDVRVRTRIEDEAEAALRRIPEKAYLELVRADWAELRAAEGDLPRLTEELAGHSTSKYAAQARRDAADLEAESARRSRDEAEDKHWAAAVARDAAAIQRDLLAMVSSPNDLEDIAETNAAVRELSVAGGEELAAAESRNVTARNVLSSAPDELLLGIAKDRAGLLQRICVDQMSNQESLAVQEVQVAEAKDRLQQAVLESTAAGEALDQAIRVNQAHALREHLAPGLPCPVCTHVVDHLPGLDEIPSLDAVRQRRKVAEQAHGSADRELGHLTSEWRTAGNLSRKAMTDAGNAREELLASLTKLRIDNVPDLIGNSLQGSAVTQEWVDVVGSVIERLDRELANRTALAVNAHKAEAGVLEARKALDAARTEEMESAKALAKAHTALVAARDPLVALGAPGADNADVVLAWRRFVSWAANELTERQTRLGVLAGDVASTKSELEQTERGLTSATAHARRFNELLTEAALAEQEVSTALNNRTVQRDGLKQKLADAPAADEAAALLAVRAEQQAVADEAENLRIAAQDTWDEHVRSLVDVDRRHHEEHQRLAQVRDPLAGMGAPLPAGDDLTESWTKLDSWAKEQAANLTRSAEAATQELAVKSEWIEVQETALVTEITAAGVTIARDGMPGAEHVAEKAAAAVETELSQKRLERERLTERVKAVRRTRDRIEEAQERASVAKLLADLMRTDKFRRWLIGGVLDGLVAEASQTLSELSNGQFELSHDNSNFLIIDHFEADTVRPIKTLSGGETFQASLALALALASQQRMLAASSATRLESIFIDEGFGGLDEGALETVASTLENLAMSGDRMVGVITHVTALAERVPVRYQVTRGSSGSHVIRETA
jgi:exonuclease SbcC